MRVARDLGTVSHLLPDGVATLREAPYPLFIAIRRALTFLDFAELREEDIPPRKIWLDNEALNDWFKEVKRDHGRDPGYDRSDMQRNAMMDVMVK